MFPTSEDGLTAALVYGVVMRLEELYHAAKGLPTVEVIEEFAAEARAAWNAAGRKVRDDFREILNGTVRVR